MPMAKETVLDWMESKEGNEYLTSFIDAMVDRQIQRFQGSIGGTLKGTGGINLDEGFSKNNILQMIFKAFANKTPTESSNSSQHSDLYYRNVK